VFKLLLVIVFLLIGILTNLIFATIQIRELAKAMFGYTVAGVEISEDEYSGDPYSADIVQKPTEFVERTEPPKPTAAMTSFFDLFPDAGVEIVTDEDEVSQDKYVKGGYYD